MKRSFAAASFFAVASVFVLFSTNPAKTGKDDDKPRRIR